MGKEKDHINLQYDRQETNQAQQNAWQSSENEIDRNFQRDYWTHNFAAENDEWWKRFHEQNKYNSPSEQVSRLMAAGINPSAALNSISDSGLAAAGGSSNVTSPSLPGPHSVTPIGLQNPVGVSSDAQLFSSIAQLADSLSKGLQTGINWDRQQKVVGAEVENIIADTNQKRESANQTKLQSDIISMFGSKQAAANILKTISESQNFEAQGRYADASSALQDAVRALTDEKRFALSEQRPAILQQLNADIKRLNSQTELNRVSAKEAITRSEVNISQASYFDALAATENLLRDGRYTAQELVNSLDGVQLRMSERRDNNELITNKEREIAIVNSLAREQLINESTRQQIVKAVEDNNWNAYEHYIGVVRETIGAASDVISVPLGQMNHAEKLKLQRDIGIRMSRKPTFTSHHKNRIADYSEITYE